MHTGHAQAKPAIFVTYNGDFFDFPFIEARAAQHGLDMAAQLGFRCGAGAGGGGECLSKAAVHMDCLHWVNRDSYLPQGQRGLKVRPRATVWRAAVAAVAARSELCSTGLCVCRVAAAAPPSARVRRCLREHAPRTSRGRIPVPHVHALCMHCAHNRR